MVGRLDLLLTGLAGIVTLAAARDVPQNLQTFKSRVQNSACPHKVSGNFRRQNPSDPADEFFCQDSETGVLYIKGPGKAFTNMDVDCDGDRSGSKDDGRCGGDTDGGNQSDTAFEDSLKPYGIKNLNPYIHSYVVFGADGTSPSFKPENYGMQPLSTMAVVCGDKLFYGVWGDTNGDSPPVVGEASLALATACFGKSMSYETGHDPADVLFIGFPGKNATAGSHADWKAKTFTDFESSLADLGSKLVARL